MKITTEGQIPKQPLPEWVGMVMTCKYCKTVFELEENDVVRVSSERGDGTFKPRFATISVHCPFCIVHVLTKYEIKN
jgi:hypothetical protein